MECWPRCSGEGGDQEPEEKSGIADHISIVTPWGSCADTFSPASPNPPSGSAVWTRAAVAYASCLTARWTRVD